MTHDLREGIPLRPQPESPWRAGLHPDDRAWLDVVEAPLRALGWQPPRPSVEDIFGPMEWIR